MVFTWCSTGVHLVFTWCSLEFIGVHIVANTWAIPNLSAPIGSERLNTEHKAEVSFHKSSVFLSPLLTLNA